MRTPFSAAAMAVGANIEAWYAPGHSGRPPKKLTTGGGAAPTALLLLAAAA